jgi:alkanesulfonate monooxygenase SsuD/methylene tetrahydromethanopterin reductase-like flavin-dependent oxidoreductase (luciferase family)
MQLHGSIFLGPALSGRVHYLTVPVKIQARRAAARAIVVGWCRHDGAMATIGAVFPPSLPPERLRTVARAADAAGLDELWLWEDCFREGGIATQAAALAWTERVRVGIGVLPVPLRNAALTAMEVSSLHRMFPGRPILGIGHGVQDWMAQVGAKPASPMSLFREYATALRALLAGERVTVDGRYVQLTDVALDWPPPSDPPPSSLPPAIHAAATGPRSLRLAGEVADGTILTGGSTPADVRRAVELAAEGRAAAGRTDAHLVTVYLPAVFGPHGAARLRADADYYGETDLFGVAGDAAAVAEGVQELVDAGATSVVLQPTRNEPDVESFVEFAAAEVRPLVTASLGAGA